MKFKDPSVELEWNSEKLHKKCRLIVQAAEAWLWFHYKIELLLTDVFRAHSTDSGIHEQWRAVDARTRDLPAGAAIRCSEFVNRNFPYDLSRPLIPSVLYHSVLKKSDGTVDPAGYHLHFQVFGEV